MRYSQPGALRTTRAQAVQLLVALLFALLVGCHREGETGLGPGKAAPSFDIPRIDAPGRLTLEQFRGKVVLLNFWATWCTPCIEELPALQRLAETVSKRGVVVVTVAVDDTIPNLQEFLAQNRIALPVGLDESGQVKVNYRLGGVPESFIIDREGKIAMILDPESRSAVSRFIGPRDWSSPSFISALEQIRG